MKMLPRHAQVKTLITSQMTSNRAVVIDRPAEGQKPEIVVRDIEVPAIQNDEVLVRMRLRTINPSGKKSVLSLYCIRVHSALG